MDAKISAFPIDPKKDTICDVIRRWSEVQPDAPALIAEDGAVLTYGTLVAGMDQVRAAVNSSGLGRGNRIAVVHSSGINMALLLYGIMSGATAVPLDPRLTASEFTNCFHERKVDALMIEPGASKAAIAVARELGVPILETHTRISRSEAEIDITTSFSGAPMPPALARNDDVAIVYGTSGTTGRSKIVPKKHGLYLLSYEIRSKCFGTGRDDVAILFRPMYYGGPFGTVAEAHFVGSSIVVLSGFEPAAFFQCAAAYGVTWVTAGPTFYRAIHRYVRERPDAVKGTHIRQIRVSSAALEPRMIDDLERIFSASVETSYGLSEAGRVAVSRKDIAPRRPGTVGVAIDRLGIGNAEIRIRSLEGEFVPPGVYGEVVIRGDQVFDGYENNPEANAQAFVDGWFRTGDEGFIDKDGYLTLTGRIKEMINRGGEKVSPAEVDAALMRHPEVREAATFPIAHPTLGEEVAAAVVKECGSTLTHRGLTHFLLDTLVGFKVPRRILFVDEIPKSPAGKVQRYALAEALGARLDPGPAQTRKTKRRPSPLEFRLQRLWGRALGIADVGLDDNFFLLGGDSLQAVELFLEIERSFKQRLPLAVLFEAGTVAEMALLIEDKEWEPQGAIVPIQPLGDRPPFFCVHGVGGEAITLYHLSKHLGTDQPFYGIQSIGWDRRAVPFTRAGEMAAHYVAEMRKIQPHGPYFIGGQSFGGRIAVYMARQLREMGEEVALLALFDTIFLAGRRFITPGQWLEKQGSPKGAALMEAVLRYLRIRLVSGYRGFYDRVLRSVLFPIIEYYRSSGRSLPLALCRPDRCNRLMLLEFRRMPTYDGDAVYFKAETDRNSTNHPDTRDAWNRVIKGRLKRISSSGTHNQMMREPHARSLAKTLARELERTRKT